MYFKLISVLISIVFVASGSIIAWRLYNTSATPRTVPAEVKPVIVPEATPSIKVEPKNSTIQVASPQVEVIDVCLQKKTVLEKNGCYYEQATKDSNEQLCLKIDDNNQVITLRLAVKCIIEVAKKKKQKEICNLIPNQSSRQYCLEEYAGNGEKFVREQMLREHEAYNKARESNNILECDKIGSQFMLETCKTYFYAKNGDVNGCMSFKETNSQEACLHVLEIQKTDIVAQTKIPENCLKLSKPSLVNSCLLRMAGYVEGVERKIEICKMITNNISKESCIYNVQQ